MKVELNQSVFVISLTKVPIVVNVRTVLQWIKMETVLRKASAVTKVEKRIVKAMVLVYKWEESLVATVMQVSLIMV